ncbi:hypothetical protein AURDEDRAFT_156672 [Auricularia subglabra TFB-10046 SS5]|nr:hypothetical protein AURDEDRAFT_156672 [Auricularia subglabra TFB-10046 SS5]
MPTIWDSARTYSDLAYAPVAGLPSPGKNPYPILNRKIYHVAKRSVNASRNLEKARNAISNNDTPFWEPIDMATNPGDFVDRLFTAAKNLTSQTIVTSLWMEDARILLDVVKKLKDKNIASLFRPLTRDLKERLAHAFNGEEPECPEFDDNE